MFSEIHFTSGDTLGVEMPPHEAVEVLKTVHQNLGGFISIETPKGTAYVRQHAITHITPVENLEPIVFGG
jgi:hypothetical protein